MHIQLYPDIPPLDTPAFDDWLHEWHRQNPDLFVVVRAAIQAVADRYKDDLPALPAPKFVKAKKEKPAPAAAKVNVKTYAPPKPKPVKAAKPAKPVYKKPPKPEPVLVRKSALKICPTCQTRMGSALTAGYCLPCWQMHLSKQRNPKQASIDTLPEPLRTLAPAIDKAIDEQMGSDHA